MDLMHLVSQIVGHNIQMAYYLILTTHIPAVGTYWII